MNIFLTNDDAYEAKGLRSMMGILSSMVGEDGLVEVIAPKSPQSGMAMALTLGLQPIAYKHLWTRGNVSLAYLDATPASCVKFVTNFGQCKTPDVVVSGINHGINATTSALYSGTLGAAAEGTLCGMLSVGVSLDSGDPEADFSPVETFFPGILRALLASPPTPHSGIYYNVNFPALAPGDIRGIRVSVMGRGRWIKEYVPVDSPLLEEKGISRARVEDALSRYPHDKDESLYMMLGEYLDYPESGPRADNHVVAEGYISIVAHSIYSTSPSETLRLEGISDLNCDFPIR